MKLTIAAAAALIGLATAFGPPGAARAASLSDATPVIEVGGRHSDGFRSGYRSSHRYGDRYRDRSAFRSGYRSGDRQYRRHDRGYRRHDRDYSAYAPRRQQRYRGHGHGRKHQNGRRHGHGHGAGPYVLGGVVLGTFLILNALQGH